MKKLIGSVMILMTMAGASIAQKPAIIVSDKDGWHKIGETTVNFKTDKDNIVVMGNDRFRAIKFKVTDASIDLQDLEVYYEKEKGMDDKGVAVNADVDKKSDGASATVETKTNSSDNSAKSDMNYESISVRTPITAGMESRQIDLKNGNRELKRVVFTYKTLPNEKNEKASVELWGLK